MSDPTKQQPGPVPPPQFPFAPPVNWPTEPHGTFNGLGVDKRDAGRQPEKSSPVDSTDGRPTGMRP